jgi:glycosyltransferase involved in cell wall biosynthesis
MGEWMGGIRGSWSTASHHSDEAPSMTCHLNAEPTVDDRLCTQGDRAEADRAALSFGLMAKNKPIHTLIIDNSPAMTGALRAILHVVMREREEVRASFVLPSSGSGTSLLREHGFHVESLPFVEIRKSIGHLMVYGPCLLANGWRLSRIVKRHKIDVLHCNDFYNLAGLAIRLFGVRIPTVTHVRFIPHRFGLLARLWAALHLRFSDKIVCVSEAVRSYFPPHHQKVIVIPDSLPEDERYEGPSLRTRRDTTIELLYLSNYIPGKGQDLALSAFEKAFRQNPGLRLTFVGGDMGLEKNRTFRMELERKAMAMGLHNVVTFEAFADDVEAVIKRADIVLNFSESESFSMTCLEALYHGIPLIASDCGGPAELFEHDKSGLLVPNRDIESMTKAILELALDSTKRQQFAAEGRSFVRSKFGREQSSQRLVKLYQSLVERPRYM